jgi:hypothetical protein
VFLDGVDVRDLPLAAARRHRRRAAGAVPLLDTLADNIAFGAAPSARTPEAAIRRGGAAVARLDKDVDRFPHGLRHGVGERGITLSGGQKQRTALARALSASTRASSSSTTRCRRWTRTPRRRSSRAARRDAPADVDHRLAPHLDRARRRPDPRARRRPHRRAGTHDELVAAAGFYAALYRQQLLEEELAASSAERRGHVDDDDEVLGKAYDARLMRRLLGYLRPYWAWCCSRSRRSSPGVLQLAQPWLVEGRHRRAHRRRRSRRARRIALVFLADARGSFALEFTQTWTLQMTGQRIMFDLRLQIYGTCSGSTSRSTTATRSAG